MPEITLPAEVGYRGQGPVGISQHGSGAIGAVNHGEIRYVSGSNSLLDAADMEWYRIYIQLDQDRVIVLREGYAKKGEASNAIPFWRSLLAAWGKQESHNQLHKHLGAKHLQDNELSRFSSSDGTCYGPPLREIDQRIIAQGLK